jgi:hypothetical protein
MKTIDVAQTVTDSVAFAPISRGPRPARAPTSSLLAANGKGAPMSELIFEGYDSANQATLFVDGSSGIIAPIMFEGAYSGGLLTTTEGPLGGQEENILGPNMLSFDGVVYIAGQTAGAGDDNGALGLFVYNPADGVQGQSVLSIAGSGVNSVPLNPADFVAYNNKVYFDGDDSLWVTNGTPSGTHSIARSPGAPQAMAVYDGELFMNGVGADHKDDLIAYNSTAANNATHDPFVEIAAGVDVTDMAAVGVGTVATYPGLESLTPASPTDLFVGGARNLYVYNGTSLDKVTATGSGSAGLDPLDIVGMSSDYFVRSALSFRGQYTYFERRDDAAYFSGVDNSQTDSRGLWVTQGSSATEVAGTSGLDPYDLTAFNGSLYFTGKDSGGGRGLWEYTPNAVGGKVAEVLSSSQYDLTATYNNHGGADFGNLNPITMGVSNGHLYFAASGASSSNDVGLYELTGTTAHPTATAISVSGALAAGVQPGSFGVL